MNRIIYKQGSTLTDITDDIISFSTGSADFDLVAASGALYIGADHPFNSIWIEMKTPNATQSTTSIKYWDDGWIDAVESRDGTEQLTKSGRIQFTPNRKYTWERESTNYEGDTVTDLESLVIYDKYWLKITFGANFDAGTQIQWIGFKFSDDTDLGAEYPDLVRSNVISSFKAGKTNWDEQHAVASELLVNDLIDRGLIKDGGQIISHSDYRPAAVSKCAEIIFRSFGDDYVDRADKALAEYNRRISKRNPTIDRNANATQDAQEVSYSTGWLSR